MHVAIKLLSWIFKIFKLRKIQKNNQQKILFKMWGHFSNFQKTGIYVKEPFQVNKCSKFQVDILKMHASFGVLKVENGHF